MTFKSSLRRSPVTKVSQGVYSCKSITGTTFFIEQNTEVEDRKKAVNRGKLWVLRIPAHNYTKMFSYRQEARNHAVSYFQSYKHSLTLDI